MGLPDEERDEEPVATTPLSSPGPPRAPESARMLNGRSPQRSVSSTKPSDDGTNDSISAKPPLPPDGGWGWIIVVCSFLCNGVVDGSCSTFGVFQSHFAERFGSGSGKIAMAGSLMAGFFMMAGPVAGALVNTVGSRVVTISGGVIATLALLLCTFSGSVDMLILTYGVMGGIGLGLIYLPSMVMVGHYFEKRRAIAAGISSSGAGVGMFIMASVSAILLEHYDWKNAMMLVAGFPLQCVFLGTLMRPLELQGVKDLSHSQDAKSDDVCSTEVEKPLTDTHSRSGTLYRNDSHSRSDALSLRKKLFLNLHDSQDCETRSEKLKNDPGSCTPRRAFLRIDTPIDTSSCHDIPIRTHNRSELQKDDHSTDHTAKMARSCHNLSDHLKGDPEFPKQRPSRKHPHASSPSSSPRKDFNKPLLKKDIFYSGSIYNLPEYKVNPHLRSYMASNTNIHPEETLSEGDKDIKRRGCMSDSAAEVFREMFDLTIFAHPQFIILVAGSIFIQLAYFVPIMFITSYALSLGIDSSSAASLISAIGISNTVGRALAGVLANVPRVPVLHLNNVSLIVAGIGTILVTLACKDFPSLVIYSCVFGLCLGAFVPLATIFLVKYLGLHRLTNAFGQLSLVKGLATMAGPPIAGALLDSTGGYTLPFVFAGSMLVTAGLVHYLLPVTQRWTGPPKNDVFSDLVISSDDDEADPCTTETVEKDDVVTAPVV